eukprot:g750.t1
MQDVVAGGEAEAAGAQVGMELRSVNDTPVHKMLHERCTDAIADAERPTTLVFHLGDDGDEEQGAVLGAFSDMTPLAPIARSKVRREASRAAKARAAVTKARRDRRDARRRRYGGAALVMGAIVCLMFLGDTRMEEREMADTGLSADSPAAATAMPAAAPAARPSPSPKQRAGRPATAVPAATPIAAPTATPTAAPTTAGLATAPGAGVPTPGPIAVIGDRYETIKNALNAESPLTVASHEKTGTFASGQLVQALAKIIPVQHNFYWHGGPGPAIEFVRNPFAMVMSAYYYHRSCQESITKLPLSELPPVGEMPTAMHAVMPGAVGYNVSLCHALSSLNRVRGLELQYNLTMVYPGEQLGHALYPAPAMRVCLDSWIHNLDAELQSIGTVLSLSKDQRKNVSADVKRLIQRAHKQNSEHFMHYDSRYCRDVQWLRRYDAKRSHFLHRLEHAYRCIGPRRCIVRPVHDFGSIEYWDMFYERRRKGAQSFEWFTDVHGDSELWAWLIARFGAVRQILHVGCGTSALGEVLANCGDLRQLRHVTNVDASSVAIAAMRSRASTRCSYEEADVLSMRFGDGAFDAVLDKGTYDALAFAPAGSAPAMLAECARVLAPGGRLIQITQDPPEERLDEVLATLCGWSRSYICIGGSDGSGEMEYFAYSFEKPPAAAGMPQSGSRQYPG